MAEAHLALQSENVKLGETLLGRKESNTAEDWVPDYPGVTEGRTQELLWTLPCWEKTAQGSTKQSGMCQI